MMKKENTNYVPTTMDELMGRFVLNMKRNDNIDNFNESKKVLEQPNLLAETEDAVIDGVE